MPRDMNNTYKNKFGIVCNGNSISKSPISNTPKLVL